MFRRLVFGILVPLILLRPTQGQNCPAFTGLTLKGTVIDPTGAVVVGARVTIGGGRRITTTVTDAKGNYRISCISEGDHTIIVNAKGFATFESKVDAGHASVIHLQLEEVHSEVQVDPDATSSVSSDGGAGTHILNSEAIRGLADDPTDLLRQLQILASTAGGAPGQAIITVDGFQNVSLLPPKSSISSIRVNPDLFSAEYDKPPYEGGRIEIFTKPGRDLLHGALFFSGSDPAFNASDPFSNGTAPAGRRHYGFELGGPIRANRSGFFVSLERRDIDEFNVVNALMPGVDGSPVPIQQTIDAPQALWLGSARTDWQLGEKNTGVISYAANVNDLSNVGSGGLVLAEAGYDRTDTEYDLRLSETAILRQNLVNEAHVGFSWKNTQESPHSFAPSLQVAGAFVGGGAQSGNLRNRERDLEIDDDLIWSSTKHTFKIGFTSLGLIVHDYDPDTFNGAYIFGGGITPGGTGVSISGLEQYWRAENQMPGGTPTAYSITSGNTLVPFTQWRLAIYGQDQWKLASNLSVSLGLRYAVQTEPTSAANLAPRVGLAWAPDKRQAWIIHARGGLFFNPVDADVTREAYRLNGVRQTQFLFYSPPFTNPTASPAPDSVITTTKEFARNAGQSPSLQAQFGVEHDFPHHWNAQANIYYSEAWDVLRSRNVNAPIVGANTENPFLAPRPIASSRNIFQFQQTGKLKGPVIFLGVNQNSYKRFGLFVGYLYFNLRTNADTPGLFPQSSYSDQGETERASWESSNRIFAVGQVNLPYRLTLAFQADVSSGLPYNVITGNDNNGDGVFNDRPSSVATPGPSTFSTPFGLLDTSAINGTSPRNIGSMPAVVHLDLNISRAFDLPFQGPSSKQKQTLTFNARSSNVLNHTNTTAVGNVVGSPNLSLPVSAEPARRIELGVRYTF